MKYEVNYDLGWSLGMAVAVAISWSTYNSVAWAVIHGILNWAYVLYYLITS
tara:strand:+ start:249 stop:401 length:153 start_codon:yes stop_codon:yes gene_type:complete